jgi:uncharacterized protein YjbI with pentapeptide repeats
MPSYSGAFDAGSFPRDSLQNEDREVMKLPRLVPARLRRWAREPRPHGSLPRRVPYIVATVAAGIALASFLGWLLYGDLPRDIPTSLQNLRAAASGDPPWVLLSSLVAAPSLLLTWWWRTVHKDEDIALAKRAERGTRFSDAVRLLGDDKLEARLGGIYTLEALGADVPEDVQRIHETLCAFVRTRGRGLSKPEPGQRPPLQPEDVQAAFAVLGQGMRRGHMRLPESLHADLSGSILTHIDGDGADLFGADLSGADLSNASFFSTVFNRATLFQANLSNAYLGDAVFAGAKLTQTNLTGAHLSNADFTGADLTDANLRDAYLFGADFTRTKLKGAQFLGADLTKANLADADLLGANLGGAKLGGAKLPSWYPKPRAAAGSEVELVEPADATKKPKHET